MIALINIERSQHHRRSKSNQISTTPHHETSRLLSISLPNPSASPTHPHFSFLLYPSHLIPTTYAPNRLPKRTPLSGPRRIQLQRHTSRAGVSERARERTKRHTNRQADILGTMQHVLPCVNKKNGKAQRLDRTQGIGGKNILMRNRPSRRSLGILLAWLGRELQRALAYIP